MDTGSKSLNQSNCINTQQIYNPTLLIIGAGQMGLGIAQVALESGLMVYMHDVDAPTLQKAKETLEKRLARAHPPLAS